jgi:2-polyprenyl-3-methyl-5-hydroxy-6-metoxy-1,4-benzoquinol methylase
MDQQELIREVISDLKSTPDTPKEGRYLSIAEAENILDTTIEHVRRTGSATEFLYLTAHRRRLSLSLTMIPYAESPDASCLDIGCYGYMAFWAWHYLGYARVEGIEMRPDIDQPILTRSIEMEGRRLELKSYNFNITQAQWPLDATFDTVLFFETLEHVDQDPSGVLLNVTRCMHRDSILVTSVPNSASYKTLREFIAGAPPWVYWFFHPDLGHEPRHSFEYTPIFFKMALRSAGLTDVAFRTICAFAEPEHVTDIFEVGAMLSIDASLFGDTILVQARKTSDEPLFRYPDCLYSSDRYYRTTNPAIEERLTQARSTYARKRDAAVQEARDQGQAQLQIERERLAQCEAEKLEAQRQAAHVTTLYQAVTGSAYWRVSGPIRRFGTRHPGLANGVRAILSPLVRVLRGSKGS